MIDHSSTEHVTLAGRNGARGLAVPVMLAVSLACNVAALILPFLEIATLLEGHSTYSLPHSVQLMWNSKLYIIAVMIVVFSILFPLAKLALMTWIWFFMRDAGPRRALLERIEPLGKWSFLDIFIVIIILVLTNDQLFVGATPVVGLYLFVAAITLSMCTSVLIDRLSCPPAPADPGERRALASEPGWRGVIVIALLTVSVPALVAAVGLPFLKISQFLLKGHAYSVVRSVGALWSEDAYVLAVIVALTLIAAPMLCLAALFIVWWRRIDGYGRRRWRAILGPMWQWMMLDVFGLALLVFLTEGDSLVKTDVKPGLYLMLAAIIVLTTTYWLVMSANRRENLQDANKANRGRHRKAG